ncbi:hypothetical protein CSKR_200597 [Clonorchis sinensis]|uniref:Uncharacterized protein n=1 Tax=Clonorchis sinensis TaxID=79923 RepID=A0A8T1MG24_CLOSI|nr:hypothetical protein CSKR_200597 [Clonorchis sinensis]
MHKFYIILNVIAYLSALNAVRANTVKEKCIAACNEKANACLGSCSLDVACAVVCGIPEFICKRYC